MPTRTVLRLAGGVTLESDDTTATLVFGARMLRITLAAPAVGEALRGLRGHGAAEAALSGAFLGSGDRMAVATWSRLLGALRSRGWLDQAIDSDGVPLLTLESTAADAEFAPPGGSPPPGVELVMSRFAVIRSVDGSVTAETPLGARRVRIHDPRILQLVGALVSPASAESLARDAVAGLRPDEIRASLRLLQACGVLIEVDSPGRPEPEQWSPDDMLFHARSRLGRHDRPFGGTFRFVGSSVEPLPAAKPVLGETLLLPPPDLDGAPDPGLRHVTETRASVREHDNENPMTVAQLGELLYRTQRLRWVHAVGDHGEVASRPYASGGGLYELEVYPVVHRCAGLDAGIYRYDGARHRLERVSDTSPAAVRLLEMARVTCVMSDTPQVLLVVAARFGRVMWKYESVAYSVILKNVGALYQSLYLHATAMGLAPCALGGGDSDLFAEATGLAYDEETSVGEFVVGSRPQAWTRPEEPAWAAT